MVSAQQRLQTQRRTYSVTAFQAFDGVEDHVYRPRYHTPVRTARLVIASSLDSICLATIAHAVAEH